MTVMAFGYVVLFTLLLAGAAAAIEHGAQGRTAARHVWTATIVFSMLAPPALLVWHAIDDGPAAPETSAVQNSEAAVPIMPLRTAEAGLGTSAWERLEISIDHFLAARPAIESAWSRFDQKVAGVALLAWGLLSLALVGWISFGVYHWRRARLAWQRQLVDGIDVDVSASTGPAVMGLLSNRIVLPEWATQMRPEHRRLVLAHETEHIRAHDPQRLALALAAIVVMPWNIALWWCAARLRRAIELDCDARVLQKFPGAKEYGYVLLEVAARGRTTGPLAVPMVGLLRLPSELERRLCAMTRSRTIVMRSAAVGGLAAVVAVSAAFAAPIPSVQRAEVPVPAAAGAISARSHTAGTRSATDTVPNTARDSTARLNARLDSLIAMAHELEARRSALNGAAARERRLVDSMLVIATEQRSHMSGIGNESARLDVLQAQLNRLQAQLRARSERLHTLEAARPVNDNMTYFSYQVEKAAQRISGYAPYPEKLRAAGIEGKVDAQFTVDTTGQVVPGSSAIKSSTNDLFNAAVLSAIPKMRFSPAEVGGKKVKQLVEQPFTFALSRKPR